jgi:hypothetical protein
VAGSKASGDRCRVFVGKCGGNRALRINMHKWENNIKIDLKEIMWGGVDWIQLTGQGAGGGLL